ncbi:DUF4968 domain-containing protein [Tamlana fucoidanivorans]|uniref:DUF4968 domain-containing protein n=1 Tax=Allotamlana fucoidanivorans TaxID=2583814 RepID=A0A5C4SMI8_9FLAO|nr:TIM-barrel domain-containing protein [Tamlana fucoidanivorans]TNJ45205.1 DUF4968 domain-containing protein [Tamlana fucoidanivorans]
MKLRLVVLALFVCVFGFTQNENRVFKSAKVNQNEVLEITVSDGTYYVQFYTPKIVETTFVPLSETKIKSSHAVVMNPERVKVALEEFENKLSFSSKGIHVAIQKAPFQISYQYEGKPLLSEEEGYVKTDEFETLAFNLTDDEVLYGGGARALGMNRRGYRLQLYNRAHYGYEDHSELMNFTLPIVMSSKRYMVHFDNAPIGYLDLDSHDNNTLTYETISGRKTYQIIAGDSWYDITSSYTNLTGKQPMLPRWALGNFSSRFGYHSQKETEMTIHKFRKEKIPVDAIILDLYWFGKDVQGTMGNLEVYKDSFPDFVGMVRKLKRNNVKTVVITEPFVLTTSKRWDDAVAKEVLAKDSLGNPYTYDFFFGNTGLIDIYKPEGEKWFWNIYRDAIISKGVEGIWGDLGEPEVHPSDLLHATGTADEVHNIYGSDWARLVLEGYQRDFPEKRPFILMRAGYSGAQRYGLVPWSGDVNRTWGGLQSQPEIALQMSMQGLAYMHSDLGGFAGANLDDELYTRWLQYGVFQPIYRPHAQEEVASEPVFRSNSAKALAKEAIELRYKLLPYNYNLVYENNQFGKPLMRPLFFEEPDNKELQDYSETYLWGHDFLVAPILKPGQQAQNVYFPKNNTWFDFYTNTLYSGGQTKSIAVQTRSIPTFVRAGAFIPMALPMQSTESYNANTLQLHYYHADSVKNSSRAYYNDDGTTPNAFKKGLYEIVTYKAAYSGEFLEFTWHAEIGNAEKASKKKLEFVVHNIQNEPKGVFVEGEKKRFKWNASSKSLTMTLVWKTNEIKDIQIKL